MSERCLRDGDDCRGEIELVDLLDGGEEGDVAVFACEAHSQQVRVGLQLSSAADPPE